MDNINLNMISGHATDAPKKFLQVEGSGTITAPDGSYIYGFIPVAADTTLSAMIAVGSSDDIKSSLGASNKAYQNIYYPCECSSITVAAGNLIAYIKEK